MHTLGVFGRTITCDYMREQVRGEMCDIFNFLNKANPKIILDDNKIIELQDICLKKLFFLQPTVSLICHLTFK